MSRLVGRVRRVYTGWRAVPGKNLLLFDDAIAVVRASALDGMPFVGGAGMATTAGAVVAVAGMRRRGSKKNKSMVTALDAVAPSEVTVADILAAHPDNWAIPTSQIGDARLQWTLFKGKLTLAHGDQQTLVVFERQPNPKAQVAAAFHHVLGERFHMS